MKKSTKVKAAYIAKGITVTILYCGILVAEYKISKLAVLRIKSAPKLLLAELGIMGAAYGLIEALMEVPHRLFDGRISRWQMKEELRSYCEKQEAANEAIKYRTTVADRNGAIEVDFDIIDEKLVA